MGCRPPGSSVHGVLQTRILGGLPLSPPGDLPHPGIELTSPALASELFTTEPPRRSTVYPVPSLKAGSRADERGKRRKQKNSLKFRDRPKVERLWKNWRRSGWQCLRRPRVILSLRKPWRKECRSMQRCGEIRENGTGEEARQRRAMEGLQPAGNSSEEIIKGFRIIERSAFFPQAIWRIYKVEQWCNYTSVWFV